MSINKVVLVGRLTRDVDYRELQNGSAVAKFTVAVDDGWGDAKKTYFPSVVVWGKSATSCSSYLHKGSQVGIVGKLATGSYEKDGRKVYTTDVVADVVGGVTFLDSRNSSTSGGNDFGIAGDEEIPF